MKIWGKYRQLVNLGKEYNSCNFPWNLKLPSLHPNQLLVSFIFLTLCSKILVGEKEVVLETGNLVKTLTFNQDLWK